VQFALTIGVIADNLINIGRALASLPRKARAKRLEYRMNNRQLRYSKPEQ
jgi:hypothetical protein